MSYSDRNLTCVDCQQSFVFTSGEQEFFASKGFSNSPTRCPACRQARKSGGAPPRSSSRDSSGSRATYSATCSACKKETQLPFQPSGDRPVYCRDYFSKQKGGSRSRY